MAATAPLLEVSQSEPHTTGSLNTSAGDQNLTKVAPDSAVANAFVFEMYNDDVGEDETGVVPSASASMRGTLFNAVNGILGGGVLAIPFALGQDGSLLGPTLIVLVALLGERSMIMLLACVDAVQARVYSDIGRALLGKKGGVVVDVIIMLQNAGLLIGYVVVLGGLLPPLLAEIPVFHGVPSRAWVMSILGALVFFPMTCLPKLDFLRHTSLFALLGVFALVLAITAVSISAMFNPGELPYQQEALDRIQFWPHGDDPLVSLLSSVPIIFFAFVAHNTCLLLYGELRRRARPAQASRWPLKRLKMIFTVRVALVLCSVLYVLCGIFGYIFFRSHTQQDVLASFPRSNKDWWLVTVKICFAGVILVSFPVIAFALRRSVHALFWGESKPSPLKVRAIQAFCIVLVCSVIGITVPNIQLVFGLTGSITATSVMYMMPATFYLLLRMKHGMPQEFKGDIPMAVLVLATGILVAIGSTTGLIISQL